MTDRQAAIIGLRNIEFETFMDWSQDDVMGMLCDMLIEQREALSAKDFDAELARRLRHDIRGSDCHWSRVQLGW
jgi:hypothetical protein